MEPLVDLVSRLFPFSYSVTGPGNDAAGIALQRELPFDTFEYESGRVLNGWLIPHACEVECAELRLDGRLVYDGTASSLGVPAQSDSFEGRVSLADLRPHLFSHPADPEAIPYHWSRLYRPDTPVWGFCMPDRVKRTLGEGVYDVRIVTRRTPTTMKVFVHELKGNSDETILLNAHNCHPYQANDDISGVAVGIELMRRLAARPERRFTYSLMIAPELFGPLFWLAEERTRASRLRATVMLKSVGNDRPLRLQESFNGDAPIDLAAHNVFRSRFRQYESGEFRAVYGNDETVFEAPPFSIPSISLTRWPFPEYHTDRDTPDRIQEDRLEDTVQTAFQICEAMEADVPVRWSAEGLVCLSRYGLYKPVPPVGELGVDYTSTQGRWNRLMNSLPRLLDGRTGLVEIAERFQLPIQQVHEYVMAWVDAGLAVVASEGTEIEASIPTPPLD